MKFLFNAISGAFDAVLNLASEISYDNAGSGLTADNVQDAIDEVQLEIDSLPDPISYKGTWSAATNTPTLSNSDIGVTGFLYQCNVAGTVDFGAGPISFDVGDKVVNNGTIWEKWDMTDAVTSVNGATGSVTVNAINQLTGDVTAGPAISSISMAATLATVNSNVGSFGTASSVSTVTVNGKGLTTAASNTPIQIAESQVTNLVTDLAAKQSTTLTSAHILVGNGSNVATDVAMSGDIAITNAGATSYSGIVPMNKGGTNKNMTAVAGAIAYSDADSLELTAVGTQDQYLKSNVGSAPTWASFIPPAVTSITAGSSTWVRTWVFVVSGANATAGAEYSHNGNDYTVKYTISSGSLLYMIPDNGSPAPLSSGTLTKFSGTGDATITFTAIRSALYLKVKMVGGGAGGTGSSTTAGSNGGPGGAGSNSTFGSSLLTAPGAAASAFAGFGVGGIAPTINSPAIAIDSFPGGAGMGGIQTPAAVVASGGVGGSSAAGGSGGSTPNNVAGGSAAANTGSGGAGGAAPAAGVSGTGGGSGSFLKAIISSPGTSYSYAVGAGGAGGTAGTGGVAGGSGASGNITIEEYYQ